jgi:hypothetical protein
MSLLKRFAMAGLVAGMVVSAGAGLVLSQTRRPGPVFGPLSDPALGARPQLTLGRVTAIEDRGLTIDVNGRDIAFTVDEDTDVLARGTAATRKAVGGRPITDIMRRGDFALVSYRESSGALLALEIHVKGRVTLASR